MQLRLKSRMDVRVFTLAITLIAVLGNFIMEHLFLPADVVTQILVAGTLISIIIATPISYFVGSKILENHNLSQALLHATEFDVLTGAATRLSFYKQLEELGEGPFSVVVADIDHFKSINDQHGHQVGDLALTHFTETLVRNCREEDIVARFGGEEFILLLKGATLENGCMAADRLCQRVREKPLEVKGEILRMTASFGVVELGNIRAVDEAINQADMAVYRAKATGRNRVCAYDPDLDQRVLRMPAAEKSA